MGLILNEYSLTALFSVDGIVAPTSRLKIWIFDGTSIGFGLLLVLSKSFKMFISKVYLLVIRIGIKTIKVLMNNYTFIIRTVLQVVIPILLFVQMAYMVSAINGNVGKYDIIYATDPDAGLGIKTAEEANIFTSVGFVHGVLYQRIAHYLSWFSPAFDQSSIDREKNEMKLHYTLQLISLISIYLFSFILAQIIAFDFVEKLLVLEYS